MTHQEVEEQDIVDRYLMRRLPADLETEFVDHYLGCQECVEELEASRETIAVIREACAAGGLKVQEARRVWFFRIPAMAWGVAAIVAVAVFVNVGRRPGGASKSAPGRPQAIVGPSPTIALPVITLESYRSGAATGPSVGAAVAARPFLLRLDLRGLSRSGSYLVQIVSDSGQPVWSKTGIAPAEGEFLEVQVEGASLGAGVFWVRLSGWRREGPPDFLREYALLVRP